MKSNIGIWDKRTRVGVALLSMFLAFYLGINTPVGWLLAAVTGFCAVTAVLRFCPVRYLVNRRTANSS